MAYCSSCGAEVAQGARFCHRCGTPTTGSARATRLPWIVAASALVALVIVAAVWLRSPSGGPGVPSGAAPFAGSAASGAPPDLSSMTPREAADRLFDRVVRSAENGDSAQALQFAPMALQAYGALGPLDPDARLHVGMIQLVTGDLAAALAQADSLESEYPGHLFASILQARAHQRAGSEAERLEAFRSFLANEERERAVGRQEYSEHQTLIDRFAVEARAAVGPP